MVNLDTSNFSLKMLLIGDSNVGKSALITKICQNNFPGDCRPTVGFEFITLHFNIVSDTKEPVLKYSIRDCSGQESFKNIEKWVNDVKAKNTDKTIHFVLIGTKIDLEQERVVSKDDGEKIAKANGMKFVEVSAKTGAGIEDLEYILAKIIYEEFKKGKEPKKKVEDKNDEKSKKINLEDENEGNFGVGEKHTHSSSLCDCCKKICENC